MFFNMVFSIKQKNKQKNPEKQANKNGSAISLASLVAAEPFYQSRVSSQTNPGLQAAEDGVGTVPSSGIVFCRHTDSSHSEVSVLFTLSC